MTLREDVYDQLNLVSGASKQDLIFYTNEIMQSFEKIIDEKIKEVDQEFKNEGYADIDEAKIYEILDYDDIVEYKQLESKKEAFNDVLELLKK